MLNIKIMLPIIIILTSIIGWKYVDLKWTIADQQDQIEMLTKKNMAHQVDLETEKSNNSILKQTITDLNSSISSYQARNQNLLDNLEKFKTSAAKDKYKSEQAIKIIESKLYQSEDCKAGLELNKMISELKYEDL